MHAEIISTSRRAFDAGAWAIGSRIVAKAIDLVLLLCLARLVGPDQFGLVAIAMAVVFVVEALFELPVAATLIRVDALTPDRLHTAFTLGLLRGLVVAAMLVLLAVPLAAFSEEPRLVALLAVLSLAPACRGMASPRLVEYNRAFDPRPDAAIELGGKAVAFAVALAVAATTHSYWSIAAATVCGPLAGTVLSYIVAPLRPRLTLVEWREFSGVIGWNFVAQLCGALNWQVDRIVLPRVSGAIEFGQYAMSRQLAEIPVQALITPLHKPAIAMLSAAPSRRAAAYLQLSRAGAFMLMPVWGVFIAWPEAVVTLALGERWLPAADWLRWNTAVLVLGIPAVFVSPLALALNETRRLAMRNLAELALRLPLVAAGAWFGGIAGAIACAAIATTGASLIAMTIVRRLIGIPVVEQLGAVARTALATLPAVLWLLALGRFGPALPSTPELLVLVVPGVLVFFVLYLASAIGLWHLAGRPPGPEAQAISKCRVAWARLGPARTRAG